MRIIGSYDLQWSDNPSKEEIQADTDVEIDVISMLPENPEKELIQLNTFLALMIDALNSPAVMQKIQSEGKTFNISPIVEQMLIRSRIRDPEIFRAIRPEESQGFVSVAQVREAKDNILSAVTGKQIKFPPKPNDDHVAKLEVYTAVKNILDLAGQVSDVLNQLIQIHTALLQEIQSKEANPGQAIKLSKPTLKTVGM